MAYTTIDDPSAYFQIATWTGDDETDRAITNTGNSDLQPDLVWIKCNNDTFDFVIMDSSRGASTSTTGVQLSSNLDAQEPSNTNGHVKSFNSDGFNVRSGSSAGNPLVGVNKDAKTYVAWQWKCNGGTEETTVTESGNNPGNTRQTNTTAGFSMIKYTGTGAAGTIAHGLGAVPHFIIHKSRSGGTENWPCYHIGTGNTHGCDLNRTNAKIDNATLFNDTSPTSSVFTVASDSAINFDGDNIMAWVWTSIQGFSKFGDYIGNGNADGTFVYTGFKPAWVIQKRTNSATDAHWHMFDNVRNIHNPRKTRLEANNNFGDSTGEGPDFLSNGFKWRSNDVRYNGSSDTYIYAAFAEHPFVSSLGVPVTAGG